MPMIDEKKAELGQKILLCCRNELYSLFPYLDGAFGSLPGKPSADTGSFGTEGEHLLYSPDYLIALFGVSPGKVRRGYLHVLLHLLYLHPFRRGGRNPQLWNLAADMAVEQILEKEGNPRLALGPDPVRDVCRPVLGEKPRSAEQIYEMLKRGDFSLPIEQMAASYLADDHRLWEAPEPGARETWEHVLSYLSANRRGGNRPGTRGGSAQEKLEDLRRGIGSYRQYLQQFAVSREEMELDMDSFDYIYYHLGLERYGNLPLIEPLEYREGHKLQELVIAIDTSGSCSLPVVRRFLEETYRILSSRENFFRKMQVYLIQCDCLVQSVAVIHSEEEWKNYSRCITIQGRGGTDFTPVFRYVDALRGEGKLRDLKALLYFTDGDGCFPRARPAYETAFVFVKRTELIDGVPSWAARLIAEEEETP